jgi:hypothetical protein
MCCTTLKLDLARTCSAISLSSPLSRHIAIFTVAGVWCAVLFASLGTEQRFVILKEVYEEGHHRRNEK